MIIYPAIILVLLIAAFVIVFRRAYLTEKEFPGELRSDEKISANLTEDYRGSEINPFEEKEENFQKAEELFKKKQYISAEKWYIEAVKKNPKNSIIFSRLGVIYIDQKNYADAIESLQEALRLNPVLASSAFNLSYAYNAEGDQKEAIIAAKRAIRLEPKNKKYKKWLDQLRIKPF
jgi:tetratricopeptide (TPR) repeat protein